jgi:hypothetical protein
LHALSNRIRRLESFALSTMLTGEKIPNELNHSYKERLEFIKKYKSIRNNFDREFPIPPFDPLEVLRRSWQMRERFEGTYPPMILQFPSCPAELLRLSWTIQKTDFPIFSDENSGSTTGSFTFDPYESVSVGTIRFANSLHDGHPIWPPSSWNDSTRLMTSTMLEFSLYNDWDYEGLSCKYNKIIWEVRIEAQLSVDSSNTDDFFCFTDAGVLIHQDPKTPPPSNFMAMELHPLLSLSDSSHQKQAKTSVVLRDSFKPKNRVTKLYLGFATFNMALNGELDAVGSFSIFPTIAPSDFWGVSYNVLNE